MSRNNINRQVRETLNLMEGKEKQNEIIALEKDLVKCGVDDLENYFNNRMLHFAEELETFKKNYNNNNKVKGSYKIVVSEYFFKPFSAYVRGLQPKYEYEKLLVAFEFYKEIISKINIELYQFYPTLSHFCNFLGLSVATWRNSYNNNKDNRVVELTQIIEDWMFDSAMRLSEGHEIDNVSAIFRSKVEMNKIEQQTPSTIIVADTSSIEEIKDRLKNWNDYSTKAEERKVIEYDGNE